MHESIGKRERLARLPAMAGITFFRIQGNRRISFRQPESVPKALSRGCRRQEPNPPLVNRSSTICGARHAHRNP